MAKKNTHSYTNVYFIRFDWNRRACLVCLNVLCAVSFWATAMCCCLFRFYHFRIVFIWFRTFVCLFSSYHHAGKHADTCVCIILWWWLLLFCCFVSVWTSEIITFKLKLYLGYIISVNILCCCCSPFFRSKEKKNQKRHKIFPPIFVCRPPHSHKSWPIFSWIKLAVEWPFVCQRWQCIDRETECRVQSELMENFCSTLQISNWNQCQQHAVPLHWDFILFLICNHHFTLYYNVLNFRHFKARSHLNILMKRMEKIGQFQLMYGMNATKAQAHTHGRRASNSRECGEMYFSRVKDSTTLYFSIRVFVKTSSK